LPDLNVIHRDAAILVADKPSGLLAVPGRGADKADCLAARVQNVAPTAKVVHRLDRDTSGAMVFALSREAERSLARQFQTRRVAKRYVAVVSGVVAGEQGEVDLPLRKDLDRKFVHIVDEQRGKEAITRYTVIERQGDRTRLLLEPLTGRSHQLRVHMQALGHPILGDPLYGRACSGQRLMLHAERITFEHPVTAERLSFAAPCPF
jgi:tRNA pseudouridine32 synthase/23S rRNA pseudouridine746 synthase